MARENALFGFGDVAGILAAALDVLPSKRATFIGRLQQLQRLGLPAGTNVGRSARAIYSGWHIAELALYLDLLDAGVTPAMMASHFAKSPLYQRTNLGPAIEAASRAPVLVGIYFSALSGLRDPGLWVGDVAFEAVIARSGDVLLSHFTSRPCIQLNLSARLASLRTAMGAGGIGSDASFASTEVLERFELPVGSDGRVLLGRPR